ncbi:MAG: FAA hydrolase family protein [Gammaproteobacteria bacterium]|nr:MAG: FAA hydrolase family protein [Gammaproteobacteria bacterium]
MDKIVCFGKNYQDHIVELGDPAVEKPVIFLKPPSILKQCQQWGQTIQAVLTENETHYECELVIRLNKDRIDAYTIGLDMTLRQQQALLKKNGHPWTISKVFPDACIIGPWIESSDADFLNIPFQFILDGEVKQSSYGKNMLFKPAELIRYASQFFPLCTGDILFTGTPAGVGPVKKDSIGVLKMGELEYKVQWAPKK